ncbi:hypothetical protein ASC80_01185 [Afipia sp. Root123D2]|uniref:DUF4403 family protein n=1 Tax=Afipia sp. Root123D2 TaxID=1736436 RepID=UPI0006F5F732|nr:DUF4403 family protein [Afipia sp. Root123D2]KQW22047.1 hypothetical protein ASC80_01185 [Afipia sp. Root123D2]
MRLKFILIGLAVLAVSFYASLKAMDWLWPRGVEKPVLAKLPPLPPVSRNSEIIAPVTIALTTIRDTLDRAAPRNLSGKAENPVSQILSNADISWTVTRGPVVVNGAQNALALSTPLDGKLTVLGSLSAGAGSALGDALGGLLGSNAAKQIGSVSIKSLNASAAIRGNVAMTARPEILTDWHIDPRLTAQVNLGDTTLTVAGARVAVPAQVKPVLDRTVNEQVNLLQQRLRSDRALEQSARREWTRMCRTIPLPPVNADAPPLFLEMKPTKAVAAQPRVDARNVTLMVGLQAETRITARQTKPDCPFPSTLQIVAPRDNGHVSIGVPIDLTFTEVSRIVEAQLKGRTFPDDGSGAVAVTVKAASVNAAGDRLLISLLVNAKEKKSWFGLGGEATIHIWGRPVLDQKKQLLRLADLELAVESNAAFGLLGAAARAAVPYLQHALEERATIDLKALAASAQQKLAAVITDFRKNDDGLRIDAAVTGVRLGDIAFDSTTLRVVAEATGTINVAITALPDL